MIKFYLNKRLFCGIAFVNLFLHIQVVLAQTTYYSYQSGNWNQATTWTQDPAGRVIDNPGIPSSGDAVVILNAHEVTTEAGKTVASLTIESGGTLDIGTTTGHNFGTVSGGGLLRISSGTFPNGNFTNFTSATGGIVEYYNYSGDLPAQSTYRHLRFTNNTSNNYVVTLTSTSTTNYFLNGNLRLENKGIGTITLVIGNADNRVINLKIGDAAANIPGNIRLLSTGTTANGTEIKIGNYNVIHQITVNGSLENNGKIDLTNDNQYQLATNGAAVVTFTGATNNVITGTGSQLDFYKLIVNKGTDQTYILDVNPAAFALWAPTQPGINESSPFSRENPEIHKALWIRSGTLKLGSNINIPKLADAEDIDGPGTAYTFVNSDADFFIPLAGALWIDGATVAITDELQSGELLDNASNTAITIIGKFRITSGSILGNKGAGLIYRFTGETFIEGGTVNISQFRISIRTSNGIVNRSSYIQTDGIVTVRGNNGFRSLIESSHSLFSIPRTESTFQMSGGTLNIYDNANNSGGNFFPDADNANANGVHINVAPSNFKVSGGTVNIAVNGNEEARIFTVASFHELNISRYNNVGTSTVKLLAPLRVNHTLSVNSNASLHANNNDLLVGGTFRINSNAQYIPGTNNTVLNNATDQSVILNQTAPAFHNLTIGTQGKATFSGNDPVIGGTLTINKGSILDDAGRTLILNGGSGSGVSNYGIHTGTGKIILQGSTAQNISGSDGVFTNLTINNANGVAMSDHHIVEGELRLATGILDISIHNLTLNSSAKVYDGLTGSGTNFSKDKMIRTGGNRSDGGLSVVYDAVKLTEFTFPVGVYDHINSTNKYTPATIQANTTGNYGSITVRPVNREHPNVSTTGQSLKFYWRVTKSTKVGDWTGAISATHKNYTYYTTTPDDRQGTLTAYRAARFDQGSSSWKYAANGATYDATSNAVKVIPNFNTNTFVSFDNPAPSSGSLIDGEFTAGHQGAFGGVIVYYSYQNGDWSSINTWSTTGHGTQTLPSAKPGTNAVVKIGNGHIVTITTPGGEKAGSLVIANGSTLDLTTTTGNDFGTLIDEEAIGGTGTLRISSQLPTAEFPAGDFGEFISENGGTVEYYSNGVNFTLPTTYKDNAGGTTITRSLNSYKNLVLNAVSTNHIDMPELDLSIFADLTVGASGTFTGIVKLSVAAIGNIVVNKNLKVLNGTLQLPGIGTNNRDINIKNDIIIGQNGIFAVENTGDRLHALTIGGNLKNDNIFDMYPGISATSASVCKVTFINDTDTEISGTGSTTDFYQLIISKGTSQTPVLHAKSSAFSFRSGTAVPNNFLPLILNFGTFKFSVNTTISLSTNITAANMFTIPEKAKLSIDGGVVNIGDTENTFADLLLAGKLEILSGVVNIGKPDYNSNNDIEYATAASPEIEIKGGNLFVNGQVRRGTGSELGTLIYKQSSGQVTINGRATVASRAKLEIPSESSVFNMSGGEILFVRGGGNTYGDIYLRPGTSQVTGGTIKLSPNGAGNQTYKVDIKIPVWNLEITGGNQNATALLSVNALQIQNNLTINTSSTLTTNGIDVLIGGDFTNLGTYTSGLNTTVFNGSKAQKATINTPNSNFNNLTIDKPVAGVATDNILTFESTSATKYEAVVINNLLINGGIVENGARTITVNGNITNNATHQSTGTGKIVMTSTSTLPRTISGNGTFGRLEINDSHGVIADGNITIATALVLTSGIFDIKDKLLTLGPAIISVTGINNSRFIRSNGVLSDSGVRKLFNPGGNFNFTWPVGSPSGYTPAQISGSASIASGGSVTVKPVDAKHPATRDNGPKELKYFWSVISNGISDITNISHQYTYIDNLPGYTMVQNGEESYVPARYDASGFWVYGTQGNMSTTTNTLGNPTFSTNGFKKDPNATIISNVYLDGDYTAGWSSEFAQVPIYYSRNNASNINTTGAKWDSHTTWSIDPINKHNGNVVSNGDFPNGAPVVIAPGHIIIANEPSDDQGNRYAAALELGANAVLDLSDKTGHNLGEVTGTGKIIIKATSSGSFIFPAGDYSKFVQINGGTFEFNSDIEANMPVQRVYNNIIFTGSGIKNMAQTELEIRGNWINTNPNGSTLFSDSYIDVITLTGTSQSIVSKTPIIFNKLIVNGTGVKTYEAELTIDGPSDNIDGNIVGELKLTTGILSAVGNSLLTVNKANVVGGNTNSFVSGPLAHVGTGSKFFPIGKGTRYRPVILTIGAGNIPVIKAEMFNNSPLAAGGVADKTGAIAGNDEIGNGNPEELEVLSDIRYWKIEKISGTVSNVKGTFAYDPSRNGDNAPAPTLLRIAKSSFINGVYKSLSYARGANASSSNPKNFEDSGLQSITSDTFHSFSFFALASVTPANPLPVRLLYLKAKSEGKDVILDWATASELNNDRFEVERSIDGKNFDYIGLVPGKGTVQEIQKYIFTDSQVPAASTIYYRLRQVNTDGTSEYSKIADVQLAPQVDGMAAHWSVYPNPLRGDELEIMPINSAIEANQVCTFRLYHISGQMLFAQTTTLFAAVKELRKTLVGVPAGLYFLQIDSNYGRDQFKLLKY